MKNNTNRTSANPKFGNSKLDNVKNNPDKIEKNTVVEAGDTKPNPTVRSAKKNNTV